MRKEHAEIQIRQIWSSGLQGTGSRRESDMLALTKGSPLVSSPWQSSGLQTPRSEAVPPRRSESLESSLPAGCMIRCHTWLLDMMPSAWPQQYHILQYA